MDAIVNGNIPIRTLHFGGVPVTSLRIVFDIAYDMDVG